MAGNKKLVFFSQIFFLSTDLELFSFLIGPVIELHIQTKKFKI